MPVPQAPEEPEKPSPQKKEAPPKEPEPAKRPASSAKGASAPTFKKLSSIPAPRVPPEAKALPASLDLKPPPDPRRAGASRAAREAQPPQAFHDTWASSTPTEDPLPRPHREARRARYEAHTPQPSAPPDPTHRPATEPAHSHPTRADQNDSKEPIRRPGRVHLTAPRRGVDATALGHLALHVPQLLVSLALVGTASRFVDGFGGPPWWLPLGLWALGGALVRHRACENALARRLFGLRLPTPGEARALQRAWREVAARAGVNPRAYQLWVEDGDQVNASVAVGRIVTVTSRALELPPTPLAAVLAHELGHHVRGHTRAALLIRWYALPARLLWRPVRQLVHRLKGPTWSARLLIGALLAIVLILLATATYGLVLLPFVAPYLTAAVSRRAELRADEHAAGLGFAEQLSAVLHEETHHQPSPQLRKSEEPDEGKAVLARLLEPHPDPHTRLHHLQRHLEGRPQDAP